MSRPKKRQRARVPQQKPEDFGSEDDSLFVPETADMFDHKKQTMPLPHEEQAATPAPEEPDPTYEQAPPAAPENREEAAVQEGRYFYDQETGNEENLGAEPLEPEDDQAPFLPPTPGPISHPPSGSEPVSETFRRRRMELGLQIQQVADSLRIRTAHLEAIEDGRHDLLPGTAYAVGFIRSYADYLSLDTDDVIARFKDEAGEAATPEPQLYFPPAAEMPSGPSPVLIVVAILMIALAFGVWYTATQIDFSPEQILPQDDPSPDVPELPDSLRQMIGEPPTDIAPDETIPEALPNGEETSAPEDADRSVMTMTAPSPGTAPAELSAEQDVSEEASAAQEQEKRASDAVPAPQQVTQQATGSAAGPLIVRALQDSWVEISNQDGAIVFTNTLMAGETYTVPQDADGLTLVTGNAGGVALDLDGFTSGPLGAEGRVLRNLLLDPETVQEKFAFDEESP